jgi:Family of unknown function (DUF6627)
VLNSVIMDMRASMKTISRILIFAMLHLCWLTSYGYAEMVPTESAAQFQIQDDRQRLLDLLGRQEVVDELGKYGISKVEATARINSLTDEEITKIAGKLDELQEGGQGEGLYDALLALPIILLTFFYVAFFPIAAGVCGFAEDTWRECIRDYEGFYTNILNFDGPCENKCGSQRHQCVMPSKYNTEKQILCNEEESKCRESCQIEEEKEEAQEEKVSERVEEELDSVPIEEDCDPGMESCD